MKWRKHARFAQLGLICECLGAAEQNPSRGVNSMGMIVGITHDNRLLLQGDGGASHHRLQVEIFI